jgi:hypothetical protein
MGPALGATGFSLASSNVGYIDSAIPKTMVRLRYDAAYDNRNPARAEFIYAKWGAIGGPGVPLPEEKVDFQDFRTMFEYAWSRDFSAWIEVPVRSINPEINENATGWGDINLGVKYALVAEDDRYVTFQFRTYLPTAPESRGLGTGHYSFEPSLLLWSKFSDKLTFEAQFGDWIPSSGTDYAGNVLFYGLGASYEAYRNYRLRISPVVELFGWTVLSGKETDFRQGLVTDDVAEAPGPGGIPGTIGVVGLFDLAAAGSTIVNLKLGARIDVCDRLSLYAGYGFALTGNVWYKDLLRLELRWSY